MCQTPYEVLRIQKQGNTFKPKEAQFSDTLKSEPYSGYSGKEEKWLNLPDVGAWSAVLPRSIFMYLLQ